MLIIKDCQDRLRWLAGRKTQILHQLDGYRKTKDFLSEMMEKVKSGLAVKDVYIEFSDEAPAIPSK
jgi:methyltransferase-like protein